MSWRLAAATLLDRVLQSLVPPVRNRVCYRSLPDYTDNAYFVFRHALQTRNDLSHVWLVVDMTLAEAIRADFDRTTASAGTKGHSLIVVHRRSLRGYWLHLRSRWIFHTHGIYRMCTAALRGRVVVCLWHGMPIKCVGRLNRVTPNPYPTFGTLHLATSHFFRYVIAAAFAVPPWQVTLGALPRCDSLRRGRPPDADRARIGQRLRLPTDRRWIVWMPTYRTEEKLTHRPRRSFIDDLPPGLLGALDAACAKHGCTVVVKLHPLDVLNDAESPIESPYVRWIKAADWARERIQLYDLIAASDALLSDISSVLIDYIPTGRPIGLFALDRDAYPRELVFPLDNLRRSRRIDDLSSVDAVMAFVQKAEAGVESSMQGNDFAQVLHEDFPESGSEHILHTAGL